MKAVLLFIVVSVAAFGQTGSTRFLGLHDGDSGFVTPPVAPKFMVHWQERAPRMCTDMGATFLCGEKDVDFYRGFHSEAEALSFANTELTDGKVLVALYKLTIIPIRATEYTVEIPQPAKTERRTKVEKQ